MGRTRMSRWEKHPEHGWRTVHKSRRDPTGDVVETVWGQRSAVAAFFVAWGFCGAGWWWQTNLDGWSRGLVIAVTSILTVYLVGVSAWLVGAHFLARFVRNV